MDLPFVNVLCVQTSAQRSAGPLSPSPCLFAGAVRPAGRGQRKPAGRRDGPNHLGLWFNVFPEHQMALIISDCVPLGRRDEELALPGRR